MANGNDTNGNGSNGKGPELHREIRLQAVASMLVQGYRVHQIASALCPKYRVKYATIKKDIQDIKERWIDSDASPSALGERRQEYLFRLQETRRLAMQGFVDKTKTPNKRFRSLRLVHDIDKEIGRIYGVEPIGSVTGASDSTFHFNVNLQPTGDIEVDEDQPNIEP